MRLEVVQDGRHITFIMVSLYEAGYGVQVVGSPAVFRELICLRKSAPIPFVIGGEEIECGISISDRKEFTFQGSVFSQNSDRHSPLVTRNPSHIPLDYNYFSVFNKCGVSHGGTANTELSEELGKNESRENFNHNRTRGHMRERATEGRPVGQESGSERVKLHEYTRIEAEQAGQRLAGQAGASEPDSLTSKLAHAPFSESFTRSAICPPSSHATSHSPLVTALRAPYFMHPSVYHRGLHKSRRPAHHSLQRRRRFRIGFFGTHDREFYTNHYHFIGMNRFQVLEIFLKKFGDRMRQVSGAPDQWLDSEIAVSIDARGGDRREKSFLSQYHYFEALQGCDFVLSPPGWCMPVSHNLIEAMFCGAIPITNGGAFMAEPLADAVNCLDFQDAEGLVFCIERALTMDADEVSRMRLAIRDYYERFLDSKAFGERFIRTNSTRILVNAEENSVPLVFPGKF